MIYSITTSDRKVLKVIDVETHACFVVVAFVLGFIIAITLASIL